MKVRIGCESSPLKASEVHGLEEKSSLAVTLNLLTVRPNSHHSLKNCGTIGGSLTLTQQFLIVPYPEHPPRNRPSMVLSPTPGRGRVSAPGSPPSRSYVFPAVSDERGERPGNSMVESRRLPPLDARLASGSRAPPVPYPSAYLRGPGTRTPPAGPAVVPPGVQMGQAVSAPSSMSMPGTGVSASHPFRMHSGYSPAAVSSSLPERETSMRRYAEGAAYPPGMGGVGSMSRVPPRLGTSASPRLRYAYPPEMPNQPRYESPRIQGLQLQLPRDSPPPPKRSRTLSPDPPSGRPVEQVAPNPGPSNPQLRVSEGEESSARARGGRARGRGRARRHITLASDSPSASASGSQTPANVEPLAFSTLTPESMRQSQEPFNESVIHPDLRSTPAAASTSAAAMDPVAGPSGLQRREGTSAYGSAEEYELEESDDEYQGPDFVAGSPPSKLTRRAPRAKIDVACDFCRSELNVISSNCEKLTDLLRFFSNSSDKTERKMRCDGLRPSCKNCLKKNEPCVYINEIRRRGPGKKQKKTETRPRRARQSKEGESGDQAKEGEKSTRRRGKGKGRAGDTGTTSAVESDLDVAHSMSGMEGEPSTSTQHFVPGAQVAEIYMPMSHPSPDALASAPRTDDPTYAFPTPPPNAEVPFFPQSSPYRQSLYLSGGSPSGFVGSGEFASGSRDRERDAPAGGSAGHSGIPGPNIDPSMAANEGLVIRSGGLAGSSREGEETPVSATTRTSGVLSSASSGEGERGRGGRKRASKRAKRDEMDVDEKEGKGG